MKQRLMQLIPRQLQHIINVQRDRIALNRLDRVPCDTAALSRESSLMKLQEFFLSSSIASEWPLVEREISSFAITDKAGGVNPGDRRAIFYLLRQLRPESVLEIGTHIGASSVHVVAALQNNSRMVQESSPRFTTVDIMDVNDPLSMPWRKLGSTYSPQEMVTKLGVATWVEFVTAPSLVYLSDCTERYDFIFLDGDHSASAVYREICAALRILHPSGVILLHDYFPDLQPLWPDGVLIPGPWLAVQRLKSEGAALKALPLGELPWTTKLGSRVTSLALLVGE